MVTVGHESEGGEVGEKVTDFEEFIVGVAPVEGEVGVVEGGVFFVDAIQDFVHGGVIGIVDVDVGCVDYVAA